MKRNDSELKGQLKGETEEEKRYKDIIIPSKMLFTLILVIGDIAF